MRKVLLLDVAALSQAQIGPNTPNLAKLAQHGTATPLIPPFGALTCPAHLSMSTGLRPTEHGIVANGWYNKEHARWFNWNRSNHLAWGQQIFDRIKQVDTTAKTASLFWRHAAHSSADIKVIERPTYWASGKKSFDFYTEPTALHDSIKAQFGGFPFPQFWGPMAGWKSSAWILALTQKILLEEQPTLTFSYAPFLDYDAQRFGPDDPQSIAALKTLDQGLTTLLNTAEVFGIDVAIVSDYGFVTVDTPVFLNRILRDAGYLTIYRADNGEMLEPGTSRAFAHCDNQIAHIYVNDPHDIEAVAALLEQHPGVKSVLRTEQITDAGIEHPRTGDLVCVAERNAWFAYPYWNTPQDAPDFEKCIAIFDKVGFDPCELLLPPGIGGKFHLIKRVLQKKLGLAVPFDVIDADPSRIRGARNVDQSDTENGALLITSWPREDAASLPMESVHDVILERVLTG